MTAADATNRKLAAFLEALRTIARGREDNGRPLSAGDAQQWARIALIAMGEEWVRVPKVPEPPHE